MKSFHYSALSIAFDKRQPQDAALLSLRFRDENYCSSSPPPITDVHGTLNTVLWGIPMIANQMTSKTPEAPTIENALFQALRAENAPAEPLLLFELTEFWGSDFDFIRSAPFTGQLVEASAVEQVVEKNDILEMDDKEKRQRNPDVVADTCNRKGLGKEISRGNHLKLMRRQMKIESEAWQRAIQEYKDTLEEMCKHQLAPNLPFMKSMFLSWFEPLVNAITAEQEAYQKGEYRLNRSSYGPYLGLLPADKLAVITMHKTVAKLLTEDANVGLRVIVPVLSIGEAVEQEVSLF